jgi:hypothetical protein
MLASFGGLPLIFLPANGPYRKKDTSLASTICFKVFKKSATK